MALPALRQHGRLALWLAAALLLAEVGRQGWPLLAGGLLPLAAAVLLVGWVFPKQLPRCLLLPLPSAWRADPTALACAVAMLPMLAVLPRLADWCSGTLSPAAMLTLHAAAMLLPGALLGPARHSRIVLLLAAGAAVPLLWPGWSALMTGQCLQAAAWSLAAARRPAALDTTDTSARGGAAITALALVAAGIGLDQHGPAVLVTTQLVAAVLAVRGLGADPERWRWRARAAGPAACRLMDRGGWHTFVNAEQAPPPKTRADSSPGIEAASAARSRRE